MPDLRIVIAIGQYDPQRAALQPFLPGRVVGHLREVPDAHGFLPLTGLVDEGPKTLDERFGLLPMREVTGPWNNFEPSSRYRVPPALPISRCHDVVLGTPQQQCWDVDPMQPSFEPRIVHIGLPAVERERLTAADDRRQLALRQVGEVNLALRRICPGQPQIL